MEECFWILSRQINAICMYKPNLPRGHAYPIQIFISMRYGVLCNIQEPGVKNVLQIFRRLLYMNLRRLVNAMRDAATTFGKCAVVQKVSVLMGERGVGWLRWLAHATAPIVAPPRRRGLPRAVRFLACEGFDMSPPPSMNLMSSSMLRESLNLLARDA